MTPSDCVDQNRAIACTSSHPPSPTHCREHRQKSIIPASVRTLGRATARNRTKLPSKALLYMEKSLLQCIRRQQLKHMVVTTSEIQKRAMSFYHDPSTHKKFCASHGWVVSFIRRKRLKNIRINTIQQRMTDELKSVKVCEATTSDSR